MCWSAIPKWINEKEKSRKRLFAKLSNFTLESINLGEYDITIDDFVDLKKQIGKKPAKEQLNKQKRKNSAKANVLRILNKMKGGRKWMRRTWNLWKEQMLERKRDFEFIKLWLEQRRTKLCWWKQVACLKSKENIFIATKWKSLKVEGGNNV